MERERKPLFCELTLKRTWLELPDPEWRVGPFLGDPTRQVCIPGEKADYCNLGLWQAP